ALPRASPIAHFHAVCRQLRSFRAGKQWKILPGFPCRIPKNRYAAEMGSTVRVFLLVLIGLICFKNGSAISCYECNSANDKRCLGDAKNILTEDLRKHCPERKGKPYSLCRKIKQVIDFEVNGLQPESRVIRSCGWEDTTYANRCYQRSGFGGRQEVCACQNDNCNGSSTILASASFILGAIFLKIYL
ncbi:unnamed protein product, partial [Phaedon cochleariae]